MIVLLSLFASKLKLIVATTAAARDRINWSNLLWFKLVLSLFASLVSDQNLHARLVVLILVDTDLHDILHQTALLLRWCSLGTGWTRPILVSRLLLLSKSFIFGVEATSFADARKLEPHGLAERGFRFLKQNIEH